MKRAWISLIITIILFFPGNLVQAQEEGQTGPVYIVQSGDTLWSIAVRFNLSVEELASANGVTDPQTLNPGDELVIPGMEGIQGILTTREVPYGESLSSLSRSYRIPVNLLVRLNRITSPVELYASSTMIYPDIDLAENTLGQRVALSHGQSLFELAITHNTNQWQLVMDNFLDGTWAGIPEDILRAPGISTDGPGALPEQITSSTITPSPLIQGKTIVVNLSSVVPISLSGSLIDNELNFFELTEGEYFALQGVHALAETGLHALSLEGQLGDGSRFLFSQLVPVNDGDYPYDPVIYVDPATIDPEVTKPEDELWSALAAPVTPDKLWQDIFSSPVAPVFSECWPSQYGSRRSYNGSEYKYFHTGLDFCGGLGEEIYAPAAGAVVFAGPLSVRGNATMIDHGWGIYSAYMHQSEIMVGTGEQVEAGQLIGLVGSTGRVSGPHLHWEILVGGIQVNPLDWLQQAYP
jgi:murein DD-endopeptidase MepM/ murein hydrolase activator NlpD